MDSSEWKYACRRFDWLLIGLVICSIYFFSFDSLSISIRGLISPGFKILLATSILLFLISFNNKILHLVVISSLAVTFAVNRVHDDLFGGRISYGGLSSLLETDSAESIEFLTLIRFSSVLYIILFTLVFWFLIGRLRKCSNPRKWVGVTAVLLIAIPFLRRSTNERFYYEMSLNPVSTTANLYRAVPVLGETLLTVANFNERRLLKNLAHTVKPEFVQEVQADNAPDLIVFVLGESSRKDHYSLYGYNVPTTPFLDSISHESGFIQFDNAVSPSSISREALTRILSFATVREPGHYLDKWNVIDLARHAGYKTI